MKMNQISETIHKDPDHTSHNNNNASNYYTQVNDKQQNYSHHQPSNQTSSSSVHYNVNVRFDPITPIAGKSTELVLSIIDQKLGDPINEFELVNDKLMHLIIMAEDLSYFAHIHPRMLAGTDHITFTLSHTFPESGKYKLWVDYQKEVIRHFQHLSLMSRDSLSIRQKNLFMMKNIPRDQISLKIPDKTVAQNDVEITFSISDSSGRLITNLEPLMAAGGHTVIISSDLREFLHVHPTEDVDGNWRGGPDISFKTSFPKPGLYKAWG
jgi:hypothetical protein